MRRFIPILTLGIIIIFLTFSCGDTIRTPELREAERLAELYPDSALKLLNALDSARLNEDERMLRRLLLIESKDRLYIGSPDTTEIKSLINYFVGQNNLPRIHPLLYYYAGRAHTDKREFAKALTYFKKALREIPKEGDLYLERRIHSQISGIYQLNGLSKHFLREAKIYSALSDSIASLDPSYLNRHDELAARITLATAYRILGITDTALNIYTSLEPQVKALNDSILTSGFYVSWAKIYLKLNMPSKADSLVKQFNLKYDRSSKSFVAMSLAEIEKSQPSQNINIDDMKDLLKSEDPVDQYYAARTLAEIADKKDNGHDLLMYSRMANKFYNKIQKAKNDAALVELEKIIEEADVENENMQLRAQRQQDKMTIMYLGWGCTIVILIGGAYIFRTRIGRIKLSLEFEKIQETNRNTILLLENEIRHLTDSAIPEERVKKIEDIENSLSLAKVAEEMTAILMSADKNPDDELFSRLKAALSITNPNLIEALDKMNLKPRDYQDTLLMKINIPQKICADLFSITPQAVANSRRRLFKKFGSHSDFKNWKDFIDSF